MTVDTHSLSAGRNSATSPTPLVSIVVPIYGVEAYLTQCVDGLLAQSYRNIEVILVDDGSPDRCGEICDAYAKSDSRVKVFHIENHGVSYARNYGIDQATGDYIGFSDPDDWAEPTMFETMLKKALETDADVVICGYTFEYKDGPEIIHQWDERVLLGSHEIAQAYFHDHYFEDYVWSKLFKRDFFDGGTRSPVGRTYEDAYFSDQIILKAKKVVGIPDLLYHYRRRRNSLVAARTPKTEISFWLSKKERYDALAAVVPECRNPILTMAADAVRRTWRVFSVNPHCPERRQYAKEISDFARDHFSEMLFGHYKLTLKFCMFMAMFNNRLSYRIVYALNRGWMKVLNKKELQYNKMFD